VNSIRNYRLQVRECEALGEYAMAEHIRDILVQEQDHQIAFAKQPSFQTRGKDGRIGEKV
jgi:hypothetical protein